ncbi:MAG TPA: hypothetical protein VIR65_14970 [Rhizorhapis sp.]
MYDLVDRPIAMLPTGSLFLLRAMRGWALACRARACPPGPLVTSFLKAGAIEALPHFHIAMAALNSDALGTLHFNCIHKPVISDGEAILLQLWSDLANGNECAALRVMELLVKADAVSPVFSAMRATVLGLNMAGLAPLIAEIPKGNA